MVGLFRDTAYRALNAGLDAAALRHQVIAHNIANVDTPEFKASDVSFEAQLREALTTAGDDGFELDGVAPLIYRIPASRFRNDGNTVDIEFEAVKLSQNTERYNAIAEMVRRRLAMLRRVVSD